MEKYFHTHKKLNPWGSYSYLNWPFLVQDNKENILKVHDHRFDEYFSSNHKEFKNLLQKMLKINPDERISCEEALKHPFFSTRIV
jgi:serine/threonine protein kinase